MQIEDSFKSRKIQGQDFSISGQPSTNNIHPAAPPALRRLFFGYPALVHGASDMPSAGGLGRFWIWDWGFRIEERHPYWERGRLVRTDAERSKLRGQRINFGLRKASLLRWEPRFEVGFN